MPEAILLETVAALRQSLGAELNGITVERAVVGLFFTGVKLSVGVAGACATPVTEIPAAVCCPSSALAMPFAGKLHGRPASDLLNEATAPGPIRRTLGIATMNALADLCWQRQPADGIALRLGIDGYAAAAIAPGEHVVVIGAFVPFLKALKRANQRFTVLERNAAALKPDEMRHFRPADQAASVLPEADVVLITGTTLLNHTLEDLLALCRKAARVVVVGPTVSLRPDAFLRRGVDILGGIQVTAPDAFLDVLAQGGSGYHFFGRSAEKVVLSRQAAVSSVSQAA